MYLTHNRDPNVPSKGDHLSANNVVAIGPYSCLCRLYALGKVFSQSIDLYIQVVQHLHRIVKAHAQCLCSTCTQLIDTMSRHAHNDVIIYTIACMHGHSVDM